MANSAPADSELTIRLALDATAATSALKGVGGDVASAMRDISAAATAAGASGADAMSKTAEKARAAAAEVRAVGESARMSAARLRMVAASFTGMTLGAVGAWQDAHGGRSSGLDYAESTLSGGLQGAAAGAMVGGPWGALAGGALAAGTGAFSTYQRHAAAEKADAEAREKAVESMHGEIEAYETLRARTEAFQKTLAALGNEETGVEARTAARTREISRREAEDERLASAQRDAAARADESAFRSLSRDRTLNAQELSALRASVISAPESRSRSGDRLGTGRTDDWQRRGFDLFGGVASGVQDAAVTLAREGNAIAREQLQTQKSFLEALRRTSSRLATWG